MLMWEMQHRARLFRIIKCYTSSTAFQGILPFEQGLALWSMGRATQSLANFTLNSLPLQDQKLKRRRKMTWLTMTLLKCVQSWLALGHSTCALVRVSSSSQSLQSAE